MPDVLNRVTRSGVVVKSWSCELLKELALQDLFGERGVEDSGSDLFWSALDLQFSLLDPSYDQLVEGTDVWRFFNFFFVFAVDKLMLGNEENRPRYRSSLHRGGRQSGPPQICDGPIRPSLFDSRITSRLCLLLGSLCCDLSAIK